MKAGQEVAIIDHRDRTLPPVLVGKLSAIQSARVKRPSAAIGDGLWMVDVELIDHGALLLQLHEDQLQ